MRLPGTSPIRLFPLPTFPPFRPSFCPTVLSVVFLSLLYRRTCRRGQIQSDLAMVCLGWLKTGPSHGSLLVLASQLGTRMQPYWSTLDFYNIAEYIQLAFFSSSPCGWCTRIRPTLVDQLSYLGLFPSNSFNSRKMSFYIPHICDPLSVFLADGRRINGHCSRFPRCLFLSLLENFGGWRTA